MRQRPGPGTFALVLALATGGLSAPPALAAGRDLTGYPAPEIHVPQGLNGFPAGLSLAQLRGHVVVVKFWFSACPPCRASLAEFQALHDRYASRGVWFLAIATDDRAPAEAFIRGKGYTFPVGFDPEGVTSDRFGVYSFPTNYVVGADGTIRGYGRVDPAVIERELLAAPAPAGGLTLTSRRAGTAPGAAIGNVGNVDNVSELGPLPPRLERVAAAARANDYGEVLRILDREAGPGSTGPLGEARARIRAVALRRFENRVDRARHRWIRADYTGSYVEVRGLARDFRGTERGAWATEWLRRYEDDTNLQALHVVSPPVGTAVAARR